MLLIFGLYDFAENMDFWGINVTYGSKNGRRGLIFESVDKVMIKTETEIFINQYNLNQYKIAYTCNSFRVNESRYSR